MMVIDLNELRQRREPLFLETEFEDRQLELRNDVSLLRRPVRSRLKVSLSGERVRVAGTLEADLQLTCCRCLKPFEHNLEKGFELDYWPDPAVKREGEELALTYQDLEVGFYRGDQLDLTAVVCEQIVLEIPMKPICREACKGLCDQCGVDLNSGKCDCEPRTFDPRLAALWELKKRLSD